MSKRRPNNKTKVPKPIKSPPYYRSQAEMNAEREKMHKRLVVVD